MRALGIWNAITLEFGSPFSANTKSSEISVELTAMSNSARLVNPNTALPVIVFFSKMIFGDKLLPVVMQGFGIFAPVLKEKSHEVTHPAACPLTKIKPFAPDIAALDGRDVGLLK
jgi:hypothetical protein